MNFSLRCRRIVTAMCVCALACSALLVNRTATLGDVSYDQIAKSIVLIDAGTAIGTGFFVYSTSTRSIILTAQHVIGTKKSVKVYARAGYRASFVATVVVVDRDRDLALLSVPSGPFPTLTIASTVSTGESVAAGGFDDLAYRYFQSSGDLQPDFHPGSVSSIRGALVVNDVPTDAGNSGGPLFAIDSGEVVGVVKGSFNQNYYAAVGPSSISRFLSGAGVNVVSTVAPSPSPAPSAATAAAPSETVADVTGELNALGGSIPYLPYDRNYQSTIQISGCNFTISDHSDGGANSPAVDQQWTGTLGDVDPESVAPWYGEVSSGTSYWGLVFTARPGVAFGFQGHVDSDSDDQVLWYPDWDHAISILVTSDPHSLVAPFRALILGCSASHTPSLLQPTPTPKTAPETVAEVSEALSALSLSMPYPPAGKNYKSTVQISSCSFAISIHLDGGFQNNAVDWQWTGALSDVDPESIAVGHGEVSAGTPYWSFGFTSKPGMAFGYQGWWASDEAHHMVSVYVASDPHSLIAPFRALIESCSNSSSH